MATPETNGSETDSRPPVALRKRLARLLKLAIPEWRLLAVGTVFLVVGSGMMLAYPQAIRIIIDQALEEGNIEQIDKAAMAMGVIFLVQGVAVGLRYYLFTVAGERIVMRLRESLFRHILEQEVGFFDSRRTGELLSRLSSDTGVLQNTVSVNISMALRNAAGVIGGVGLLLYTSPRLTLIMLAFVPGMAIAAGVFGKMIRKYSRRVQDALAKAGEIGEESISGLRTVRAFAREVEEGDRYSTAIRSAFDLARIRIRVVAFFSSGMTFGGYAAVAVVLWYGGRLVVDDAMSVGDLTSFILYTLIVAFSLGTLASLWTDFMRASGAADRVFDLFDRDSEVPNHEGDTLDTFESRVTFESVSFAYPARRDVTVLRNIDLELRPGNVVALVGPSGGGKSTIAALIPRFYDPDSGRILLDGHDLRDLSADWLRTQVGSVAQEPVLFSTTVAANIRYGNADASDEEVIAAATAANAHEFVSEFPDGYDTLVGERGVQLSGGQKQRVAIARAVLKDPRILILDEATSSLDAESEHQVKEALERLMVGRTTLVIAHRLSTVMGADEVLVIEGGKILQRGTHGDLMRDELGLYRKLVDRQFIGGAAGQGHRP